MTAAQDPEPEHDEEDGVRERREDLRAAPAEAPLGRRGTASEPGGEEREAERERVREHVRRVREQREGVGSQPGERLDAREAEHEREGDRDRARRSRPGRVEVVPVRHPSVRHAPDGSAATGLQCLVPGRPVVENSTNTARGREKEETLMRRRLWYGLAVLTLGLVFMTAGCGGGDDDEASDTQATAGDDLGRREVSG